MPNVRFAVPLLTACIVAGCGGGSTGEADAAPDAPDQAPDAELADAPSPFASLGPVVELPLLPAPDPSHPFNNTLEPSVAATGGHVVVGYVQLHLDEGSFDVDPTDFQKKVALAVSHDGGVTFPAATSASTAMWTTDPVARVDHAGTFWHSHLVDGPGQVRLLASEDHGDTWTERAVAYAGDKPWIALHPTSIEIGVGTREGFYRYAPDGTLLGQASGSYLIGNAYVDAAGAHFVTISMENLPERSVLLWDGVGSPAPEGLSLPNGDASTLFTESSVSAGATLDGAQWIVRAVRWLDGTAAVVLRVRRLPGDEGSDVIISGPEEVAFFPAAVLDGQGRLHVIWYDSAGAGGVLRYTRSRSADLGLGFEPAMVVDEDACPGGGWYPFFSTPEGGRRLREYIDIAADGQRVHMVWTHAPTAPSRVRARYADSR